MKSSVTVFAPATVSNVAVGYDILGFAFDSLGDRVTLQRIDNYLHDMPVKIKKITGLVVDLPMTPEFNTATVALIKMHKDLNLDFGFDVYIEKGIPKGSGMGGSAASAVAAVVAANALLLKPLPDEKLLEYALSGEFIASAAMHADNVAPALFGGLQLIASLNPPKVVSIPVPKRLECVLIYPKIIIETKHARKILNPLISLEDHVKQSAALGGFIAGCYRNDLELIKSSLFDILIEPQRAALIDGFAKVKAAALNSGALGCSISGSGPAVFALVASKSVGGIVQDAMLKQFKVLGIEAQGWVCAISDTGARVT